jgi:tetratricopeptide (TPR) repeat protein
MVPPALVQTNRKSRARLFLTLFAAGCLLGGVSCGPPGPNALLRGKRALDERHFPEAIQELEKAARLLPKNALVWNYLGLAYHGQQLPEPAAKAYRTALALDHKLSAIRYNLGCLYLEQNQLPAAIDEFRSYSLLQPGAVDGWVRLGTALLRAHRLDEAEKAFRSALELQNRNPEALNGLGMIQMQRRRWQDALNHFSLAALHEPPYPPALLNSAVVAHQYLRQRGVALQRYRQYLALKPRPADADTVEALARNLELELNPTTANPLAASATAPTPTPTTPRANMVPAASGTTPGSSPRPATSPGPVAVVTHPSPPARSNLASATPRTSAPTNQSAASTRTAETPRTGPRTPPSPAPPSPTPKATETVASKPPLELEVAQVPADLVVKPAQDIARSNNVERAAPSTASASPNELQTSATPPPKKGFFSRLNPFTTGGKNGGSPDQSSNTAGTGTASAGTLGPGAETGAASNAPLRPVPRYNYLAPPAPTAGSRVEADKDFKRGLRAQKSGNHAQAIADYQAAVRNDPAYYDAYYNLGLAALEKGDSPLSLWAYEIALALRPDSEDARYNFALALKSGGYWLDAVEELQRILSATPSSARSHLSLANLYSQQLRQPRQAREHYERVLELNPRHPESTKIRYWLAANP